MLNRHFSNSIFDMFFTEYSWVKHANRELKHSYFHFWKQNMQVSQRFFLFFLVTAQAKTWGNVPGTVDDDDTVRLLGGAKAVHTNWKGRISP